MTAASRKPGAAQTGPAALIGDIGGTNARFALLSNGIVDRMEVLHVRDFRCFEDAVSAYLGRRQGRNDVATAALAVAGPVVANRCDLTNSAWVIDGDALKAKFGFGSSRVVNDFEALAWSLPGLDRADLQQIGGGLPQAGAPMAVLGPGTGLGVGIYVPGSGRPAVVPTEGGHATLPATDLREAAVLAYLRERHGHVSAERVLSGQGLENLYQAVIELDRTPAPPRDAAGITGAGTDGSCSVAKATLDLFCGFLGGVAGNLALTCGARGGIFIGGGIAPRIAAYIAGSSFRAQFEAKGRMSVYLAPIPAWVILRPDAAFAGLRAIAEQPG